jgi:flagellar motor protein MotB
MVAVMHGTINRDSSSYRRGLVLGLTMAEIMLLLVFCLLIALGVLISNERLKLEATKREFAAFKDATIANEAAVESIRKDPRLVEALKGRTGPEADAAISEFWRKLIESYDATQELEKGGLKTADLKRTAAYHAKIHPFRDKLDDPAKTLRDAAAQQAIKSEIGDRNSVLERPLELAKLLDNSKVVESRSQPAAPAGHNWPPIIKLSEADGYYFAVGSADLAPEFAQHLRTTIVPQLLETISRYQVDVVDVIGHTDEQPISVRTSNMDRELLNVVRGTNPVSVLKPADNAGLGLARAVAVVKVLSSDPRLAEYRILPLSGAQLINTKEKLTRGQEIGDVKERRRIEIRARRYE